jgi:glycine cleavage system pyridoxal-binding protein P
MALPTASASLNKASYAVGESIVLTINHTDADRQTLVVSGTVTDSVGNTANWSATAKIDAGVVAFTQTGGKVWTLQSATDNQSVYTATA